MDWDTANVALDQDALHSAQAAGGHFHVPWFWIFVLLAVIAALGYGVVKSKSGGDSSDGGGEGGSDK